MAIKKADETEEVQLSRADALEKLVKELSADPELLHALVFEPENVISRLTYLGRREKGAIVGMRPERVIAGLAGLAIAGTGEVSVCGDSCSDSCGNTCGSGSCFGTCYSSCDNTCGSRSCDITTERVGGLRGSDEPWERGGGPRTFRVWQR